VPRLAAGRREPCGQEVLFERDGTHAFIVSPRSYPGKVGPSAQAGCLSTDAW
jgi:hypothetical protein